MTEEQFKLNDGLRKELEAALNCPAFREALAIILDRRRMNEARVDSVLDSDALCSVRINSQRVGAEGLLTDLRDMCEPFRPENTEEPADFGAEEEARKLRLIEEQ